MADRDAYFDLPNLVASVSADDITRSQIQSRLTQLINDVAWKPYLLTKNEDFPSSYDGSDGKYLTVDESNERVVFTELPEFEADHIAYGFKYNVTGVSLPYSTLVTPDINVKVFDSDGYYDFGLNKNFVIPADRAGVYYVFVESYIETDVFGDPGPGSPEGYVDLYLYDFAPFNFDINYRNYIYDNFDDFHDYLWCTPTNHGVFYFTGGEQILVQCEQHPNVFLLDATGDFEITGIRVGSIPPP